MIVTEHKVRDLVALMPEIRLNESNTREPFFGWGTKDELDRYLEEYNSSTYPLIWLLPSEETHNNKIKTVIKRCDFIISTLETKKDLLNDDRYKYSFDLVLNPLIDRLYYVLDKSSITTVLDPNYKVFKYPNYSEDSGRIDLWDAVKLTIEVEFNDNCLRSIKWQNENI